MRKDNFRTQTATTDGEKRHCQMLGVDRERKGKRHKEHKRPEREEKHPVRHSLYTEWTGVSNGESDDEIGKQRRSKRHNNGLIY